MLIITRKDLATITEMVMTLREPVSKDFKKYRLIAEPILESDYWDTNIVGFTVTWEALDNANT